MKIFISTTTFAQYSADPLRLLKKVGIRYVLNPYKRKLTEKEIKQILSKKDYIGLIAGTEDLSEDVLKEARGLKVISRVGVGTDNIDVNTAKKLKIKIFNTPYASSQAVAELTVGLILNALRRINLYDRNMRNGLWKKEMGSLFNGKTLGIIGMGRIGRRVAKIAKGFDAKVIFSDIRKIKTNIAKQLPTDELLRSSDIVSIHVSEKETIISKREIDHMKDGSIIINVARGGLIDEEVLYGALNSNKISYAALDTFVEEPYKGKLLKVDNILLTPHIGSYAKEARIRMESEAVKNLIKGLGIRIR